MKPILVFIIFLITIILHYIFIKKESFNYDMPQYQYLNEIDTNILDLIFQENLNVSCDIIYQEESSIKTHIIYQEDDEPNRLTINDSSLSFINDDVSRQVWSHHMDPELKETNELYKNYLNDTNNYLLSILPKDFMITKAYISYIRLYKNGCVLKTNHVIYRYNKLYGFNFDVVTTHLNDKIKLIKYKILETVMEDKINLLAHEQNDYALALQDDLPANIDSNTFLCKKYKDIQKLMGITVNNPTVNC